MLRVQRDRLADFMTEQGLTDGGLVRNDLASAISLVFSGIFVLTS